VGNKVDSINFYNEKINDLSLKLETKQKITLKEKKFATTFIILTVGMPQQLQDRLYTHKLRIVGLQWPLLSLAK
jgi:hypothetical protein